MILASGVLKTENVKRNTKSKIRRNVKTEMKSGRLKEGTMLKTCKHCGVVDENHICPHRKSRQKSGDRQSDKFRKTKGWTNKSIEIRRRDKYLCQVCLRNKYNTLTFLNYKTVEVHHITPIAEDYNRRLDNDNLISLCSYHHKMADKGQIPRAELYEIVEEIENE